MKTQLFKTVICLLLALAIVLPLGGCGKDQPTYEDGHYVDAKGTVIEDKEVTLDVIAMTHYQEKFDELKKGEDRRFVIARYLEYHLPAVGGAKLAGQTEMIAQLSNFDINTPSAYENCLSLADGILAEASAALSLAEIEAKIKNDAGFEEFIGKVSKTCEIAEFALKFSKACYIVADLSNNDISNKQEYCDDIIDALSFITSNIPIFDSYFTKSLDVIKGGVGQVIKNYEWKETQLAVYGMEIEEKTFYSAHNFEWILMPDRWKFRSAPAIDLILRNDDLFDTIPEGKPYEYFRAYIVDRVGRELTNNFEPENSSAQPETPGSTGTSSGSDATTTPGTTTTPEITTRPDITPNPKCSHVWNPAEVVKEATCEEQGLQIKTCRHCKGTKEETIGKLGHDDKKEVVEPTYEAGGCTRFTCQRCGRIQEEDRTDKLAASFPVISQPTTWYGEGRREHSKTGFFKLRVDSVSGSHISGYLDVYTIVLGNHKTIHQTTFTGTGQATESGYVYLLKFDQSVTFGVTPAYTYSEMKLYYKSEKDIFAFEGMYEVVMNRT